MAYDQKIDYSRLHTRQASGMISPQSRMATGVRVQPLDENDAIAAVALVPLSDPEEEAEALEEVL